MRVPAEFEVGSLDQFVLQLVVCPSPEAVCGSLEAVCPSVEAVCPSVEAVCPW